MKGIYTIMEKDKKLNKFYIFPVLYVLSAYLMPVGFFKGNGNSFAGLLVLAPLVFGILNIVMCIKCCQQEYRYIMLSSAVIVKYCLIPFYIAGGFLITGSFISGILFPMPPMFIVGTLIAGLLCIAGWFVLAFGSPYTISYVVLSKKAGNTTKGMAALHIILQFFFTMDVIDIICLSFKAHKNIKSTIAVIILLIVAVIAIIALIFFIIFQIFI